MERQVRNIVVMKRRGWLHEESLKRHRMHARTILRKMQPEETEAEDRELCRVFEGRRKNTPTAS
jgi:hypothetical protein